MNSKMIEAYLPSDDLVDVVNLAIQLNRPLLLMGEPGCGKTRLAEAIAYELHGAEMYKHFEPWYIKSSSKAKEGIYRFDALRRLYDANIKIEGQVDAENDPRNIENYIDYGPIATMFNKKEAKGDRPNILLIDEVDKADIDFPNDLLLELDRREYEIPELKEKGKFSSENNVLIIITSNQEKELPPAFLRRCLYHYIDFPIDKLGEIVEQHIDNGNWNEESIQKALEIFEEVREELTENEKKPSTSELIDWFKMLDKYKQLSKSKNKKTDSEKRLIAELKEMDTGKIPFRSILLKTRPATQKMQSK